MQIQYHSSIQRAARDKTTSEMATIFSLSFTYKYIGDLQLLAV